MYIKQMDEFDGNDTYHRYQNWTSPKVETPAQLAGTLHWGFPTHFYKAQKSICEYEKEHREQATSLLQQERIAVVDIGAGVGTFCLALMDLLHKEGGCG